MFTLLRENKGTKARAGQSRMRSGTVKTPAFFPVATQAAVKGLSARELDEIGIQGLLVNAYHLFLRPGTEIVKAAGGLHEFMGFNKPIITDSGGYQIFSLESLRRVTDEGVEFQSHIDGKRFSLTPQDVIRIQLDLGPEVIVPLDECIKFPSTEDAAQCAAQRTIKWARDSKEYFDKNKSDKVTLFFGIVQGATYAKVREYCVKEISALSPDGIAIGGLSVGEPRDVRHEMLSVVTDTLDKKYLRYFMGYGKPKEILEAIHLGIDLFDCVVPTRFGRTGTAYTDEGKIVVRNALYAKEYAPVDKNCSCYVCRRFTRAYIRHLINANEILAATLLTYHNVFWYHNFLRKVREAIEEGRFLEFKEDFDSTFKEEPCL